jgi:hypothetical protein
VSPPTFLRLAATRLSTGTMPDEHLEIFEKRYGGTDSGTGYAHFGMDNRLVNGTILNRLFNNVSGQNEWQHTVYPLYNADGMIPPAYLGKTFDGSTNHYITTGSTVIDSQDVEDFIRMIRIKGYGVRPGSHFLILANPDDVATSDMTAWRAGIEYRTGGPLPKHDFIPSAAMPAMLTAEHVIGITPPSDFNGLTVYGSYADAYLIQTNLHSCRLVYGCGERWG